MDLSEVQKAMVPGAKEVLRSGIGKNAGVEAFLLTLISVALDESQNVQSVAARKLGVSQSFISQAVNGKQLIRYRGKKDADQK